MHHQSQDEKDEVISLSKQESGKFHQLDSMNCEDPTKLSGLKIEWPNKVQVTEFQLIKDILELDLRVANNAVLKSNRSIQILCTAVNVSYVELTWHSANNLSEIKSFLTDEGWTTALKVDRPGMYTCKSDKASDTKNIEWAQTCDTSDLQGWDHGRVDGNKIRVKHICIPLNFLFTVLYHEYENHFMILITVH